MLRRILQNATVTAGALVMFTLGAAAQTAPQSATPDAGQAPARQAVVRQARATAVPAAPINLNTATAADLETLPNVGPATATRILEYPKEERRVRQDRRPDEREGHRREELSQTEALGDRRLDDRITMSATRELSGGRTRAVLPRGSSRSDRDAREVGASLIELVIALGIASVLMGLAVPATATAIDAGRAQQAAGFLAGQFRDARQRAIMSTAATGLVFDRLNGRWIISVCADGNGDGLHRADLRTGRDPCTAQIDLTALFPGVAIAVDAALRGPEGDPSTADPVKFGSSDIASFSPSGGCTSGSLFVRSANGIQYVIRVAGVTGRTRILRYQPGTRTWGEV